MVNESLLKAGQKGPLPGYGGSRRLLVEFFFDISRTTALKWTDELLAMGYQIVLAHRSGMILQNGSRRLWKDSGEEE